MSGMRWRALVWLALACALAVAAVAQFSGRFPLQSNLLALLPPTERNPLAEQVVGQLAETAGNRAFFLIGRSSGAPAETAVGDAATAQAARRFAERLRASQAFAGVVVDVPPIDPGLLTRFYRPFRFNLLSRADRAALQDGSLDLSERLGRKLYAPFAFGPLYALADDPFGLADDWLAELPFKSLKVETNDGLLVVRDGSQRWVVVSANLPGSAYDSAIQDRVAAAVDAAEGALGKESPGLDVLRTGTVFYAVAARQSAEREFDLIGAGSLIGMLLLLYLFFRSLRPMALGLLSVGFGIATAVSVTVAVYGELHLITLVFGASLIGEAIDYAIQYFAAQLGAGAAWEPMTGLRRIAPGLLMALTTSLLGYSALLLAPFPALAQIALFALAGLGAACLSVFLLLPYLLQAPGRRDAQAATAWPRRILSGWRRNVSRRSCLITALVLLLGAFPGCLRLSANDDVHVLIARPPGLLAQEDKIRELTGLSMSTQFFLVEGSGPDDVLRREEGLSDQLAPLTGPGANNALASFLGVSAFVPSLERQQRNRADWRRKVFDEKGAWRARLAEGGLRDDVGVQLSAEFAASEQRPLTLDDWRDSPLSAPFRHLWIGELGGAKSGAANWAAIVQVQGVRDVARLSAVAAQRPGVTFVDKAGSVSRLFAEYRRWGALWLLGALTLVYGVLSLRYGLASAALMLLPTLLSMVVVLGAFGYLGRPLTLFNLMGLMLVIGVGVNYTIFLREGGVDAAATLAGVLLSAGTTLLSFGLLAFSSMPALSGFGLTLLLGICVAAVLAPMILSFTAEAPN